MNVRPVVAFIFLGLAALAATARAETPQTAAPASILMSVQIDFTSKLNGHTYRIQIAKPFTPPPPGGYPVIYVLDGDAYFGAFAGAARLRASANELESAVVVGIGYPDSQNNFINSMARRNYDLTHTQDPSATAQMKAMTAGSKFEFGHADEFYKVIETEIKPQVAATVPVNPARSALFGHSLGGLFVLHTLFLHPQAFQTYLALSPSIWFAKRDVLKDEPAFRALVSEGKTAPRIFIGVGGEEQSPSKYGLQPGLTRETEAKLMAESAMVDNVRDLAARLSALKGAPGYVVASRVFDGETHIRMGYDAVNPALNFAFPPAKP